MSLAPDGRIIQQTEDQAFLLSGWTGGSRIDWKDLLSLGLTDRGFQFSMLSEFRDRSIQDGVEEVEYNGPVLDMDGSSHDMRPGHDDCEP
jgi:hypothetical protein